MDSNVPQDWADRAAYDLETARLMLDGGRFIYVLFCCQQAVEKALKAVIIERTGKLPPRTHSLPRLVELAGIAIDQAQLDFLGELSIDYMRTRYPEHQSKLEKKATQETCGAILKSTEELTQWLLSTLK